MFLSMKLLSVEMACLLGVQNEIQAVCFYIFNILEVHTTYNEYGIYNSFL